MSIRDNLRNWEAGKLAGSLKKAASVFFLSQGILSFLWGGFSHLTAWGKVSSEPLKESYGFETEMGNTEEETEGREKKETEKQAERREEEAFRETGEELTKTETTPSQKKERHSIPVQMERCDGIEAAGAKKIRQELKKAAEEWIPGLSYSMDMENAAILVANGNGNGMEVLCKYGGEGWSDFSWQEYISYAYLVTEQEEGYETLCRALTSGFFEEEEAGSWKEYGIGLRIEESQEAYLVKMVLLLLG